ncbi:MAG: transporter substrate-binding domain-containing protein [Campylobacterales bacterium]|nr:transporter substrate-binding domain-containing protein [Campylobacterales bacterium]
MNNLIKIFLLIIIIFTNTLYSKTIKIAIANDLIPYSFVDEYNNARGLLVDYWFLWSEKTNIKIEFIPSSWPKTLTNLKEGKADIHFGIFYEKSREKHFDYISPIYNTNADIYINKLNKNIIKSINDLNGKKVGVIDFSYYNLYLKNKYPKINIIKYKRFKTLINALNNNKIDAVLNESLTTWHHILNTLTFSNLIKLENFTLHKNFFAIINKEDKELKELLHLGIKQITINDIIKLEDKWLINEDLKYTKYKKIDDNTLNPNEILYLERNKNLKLAVVKNWKNISSYNEHNVISGFNIDLVKIMNKNLNLSLKIKVYNSWSEAYSASKNKDINGILGLSWTKEREEHFSFSSPYYFRPLYLVSRKNEHISINLSELNNKIFVIKNNAAIEEIVKIKSPKVKILYENNLLEILKKIKNKEGDFTIISDPYLVDLKKYELKISKTLFIKGSELAIGIDKEDKVFTSIIKKAISSISREQMSLLKKQWIPTKNKRILFSNEELSYIKKKKTIKVGVSSWKPILSINNNKLGGMAGEIVNKVLINTGFEVKYIQASWEYILSEFKKGNIDLLPTTFYSKDYEKDGLFSDSYLNLEQYLYVNKNNSMIKSFKDLKDKKLAIYRKTHDMSIIKKKYPNINIINTSSLEESISLLRANKVDALLDISSLVNKKLNELSLVNLKGIKQKLLEAKKIALYSKKDDFILQNILQKALYSVPFIEKNIVINQKEYFNINNVVKKVNVLFGKSREPYIIKDSIIKGIEVDLINEILLKSDILIDKKKYNTLNKVSKVFNNNKNYDLAVTVQEKNDNLFYSNDFISLGNTFVTRVTDNITINSINDLNGNKVLAYKGASASLGKKFEKYTNSRKNRLFYREISNKKDQVNLFLNKKADIILIDKNIFKWFLRELSSDNINKFKFDHLESPNNVYQVAFKNKILRDIFNENLKDIKKSGKYQEIINKYILYDIKNKIKVESLFAALLSKQINDKQINEIKKISNIFMSLSYIHKIEIFDNFDKIIYETSNDKFKGALKQNIYYEILFVPKLLAYVKIYFNEKRLNALIYNNEVIIPNISSFEKLESYKNIKKIYKKFDYLNKKILFTQKELMFMRNHKEIVYSIMNWEPISIVKNNKISGFIYEYLKIIENKSSLKFKFVSSNSWEEIKEKFSNKEIDFFPKTSHSSAFSMDYLISNEIAHYNFAIVTDQDGSFADDIYSLSSKTIALPKGFANYNYIKKNYPFINIVETKDMKEALSLVAKGEVYAFVAFSDVAVFNIKKYYPNLKIIGITEENFIHNFVIRTDYPELVSIMNKVIKSISDKDRKLIRDKWISTEVSTAIDYTLLYRVLIIFFFILLIVLFFIKKLSRAKVKIEKYNEKLQITIQNLKQTQEQLISSEKMAALGGLVAGVAHEINTPVGIGLTGISHLEDSTKIIYEKYNQDEMSQEEFEEYLDTSIDLSFLVHRNLEKAASLVKSFKQVAVDQSSEEKRIFDLREYLYEILQSIHAVTKKTNIKIEIYCDPDIIINSYPGSYSQIITNLIMNSLIHGFKEKEKGTIFINVSKNNKEVKIIYTDTGKGIKEENINKIFDPFFTTNRDNGGSGLGLNIIYNIIISRLNGSIKCNSQENNGVEFVIILNI